MWELKLKNCLDDSPQCETTWNKMWCNSGDFLMLVIVRVFVDVLCYISSDVSTEKQVTFNDQDRALFLNICKVKKLSECVTTEPQTENYRPCPALQTQVRRLIPYIQRYLFHHEESAYRELQDGGIGQLIKALSFGQVRSLAYPCLAAHPTTSTVAETKTN